MTKTAAPAEYCTSEHLPPAPYHLQAGRERQAGVVGASILRCFGPHLPAAKGTCAHCRLPDCHACEAEYDLQNGGKLMVLQSLSRPEKYGRRWASPTSHQEIWEAFACGRSTVDAFSHILSSMTKTLKFQVLLLVPETLH